MKGGAFGMDNAFGLWLVFCGTSAALGGWRVTMPCVKGGRMIIGTRACDIPSAGLCL